VNEQTLALMPLLITTATVVVSMFVIALRRSHRLTGGVMIVGMNLALLSLVPGWAMIQAHPVAVTGLLTIDGTAQFAMAMMLITTLGVLTLCPAYFSGYRGHREELYLLLGVGTLGALTLACAGSSC
jgi:NADH-quinone oxidoreductase subunit N